MGSRNATMLCIGTAALVVLGLVMLASVSVWFESDDLKYSHLKRQAMWTGIGVVSAVIFAYMDYRLLKKLAKPIFAFSILLLICCYIPGIKHTVNGETRWIILPVIGQFQPSEMAKIGVMIGLAAWLAHFQAETRSFKRGYLYPCMLIGLPTLLIFFEKDMGTAAGLGAACVAVLFIAGTRLRYLGPTVLLALTAFFLLVKSNPNRWNRIMAFQDLEEHKLGFGLQQYRAILAFKNGGIDGLGLGNGAEKHGYLPYAHTDFIFPMIGEELGLWFTLGTVFCFVLIIVYGVGIAVNSRDVFGRFLALGLTSSIVIPAIVNMGVTTGVLPNTGLPLPFVSYGGTNLVFTLIAIGILVSIHRRAHFRECVEIPLEEREKTIRI